MDAERNIEYRTLYQCNASDCRRSACRSLSHCPELVTAQREAGTIATFLALNARPRSELQEWFYLILEAQTPVGTSHAVNLIAHHTHTDRQSIRSIGGGYRNHVPARGAVAIFYICCLSDVIGNYLPPGIVAAGPGSLAMNLFAKADMS